MNDYFESPLYEDEFAGMEDYEMLTEDIDEDLYEEYIDRYDERSDFF